MKRGNEEDAMAPRLPRMRRAYMVGLALVGLAALLIYLHILGPGDVLARLREVQPELAALILFLNSASVLLYGVAWWILLRAIDRRVRAWPCIVGSCASLLGDLMIPSASVTGETIRFVYALKNLGIDPGAGLASIAVHRVINAILFSLVMLMSFIALSLEGAQVAGSLMKYVILAVISALLSILALYVTFNAGSLASYIKRRWQGRRAQLIADVLERLAEASNMMRYDLPRFTAAFFVSALRWLAGILVLYFVFLSIDHPVSFWLMAFAYPIYSLMSTMPLGIPGMLGILDMTMITVFLLLGIEKSAAVAAVILIRLLSTGGTLVLAGGITATYGLHRLLSEAAQRD